MTLAKPWKRTATAGNLRGGRRGQSAGSIWRVSEGVTRNAGVNAGGVVIAPTKITDFAPLYCDEEGKHPVTQFG